MMKRFGFERRMGALALVAALALAACDDDDPVGPDPVEVDAIEIVAGETTLVTVAGQTVTGSIEVALDGELEIEVLAFDSDDEAIDLDGYELTVEIDDEEVATFTLTEGTFGGTFEGLAEGTTTVVIRITPESGGDDLYTSPEIDIVVE